MTTLTPEERSRGRWYFWAGLLLCPLALALVFVQLSLNYLATPWYQPILTTLGAGLLLAAVLRRWSMVRVVCLLLVAVLAGLEWYVLVSLMKLPEYQGPVQGQTLPAFTAHFADGRSFSADDLSDGSERALIFFRGRW